MNLRDEVVFRFEREITKSLADHGEIVASLVGKSRKAALETNLAEQLVLSSAVAWEGFLSDLFVAYVTLKPRTYLSFLNSRIEASLKEKFGFPASRLVSFVQPKTLTKERVSSLIDHKGLNLTFSSAALLTTKANNMLPASIARRFSLGKEDGAFFDFAVSMRNYLSHRSQKSSSELRDAFADLEPVDSAVFDGEIKTPGVYLKTISMDNKSRAHHFASRLAGLAKEL